MLSTMTAVSTLACSCQILVLNYIGICFADATHNCCLALFVRVFSLLVAISVDLDSRLNRLPFCMHREEGEEGVREVKVPVNFVVPR